MTIPSLFTKKIVHKIIQKITIPTNSDIPENRQKLSVLSSILLPNLPNSSTYDAFDIILSIATLHNREYVFAIYILPTPPTRDREKKRKRDE